MYLSCTDKIKKIINEFGRRGIEYGNFIEHMMSRQHPNEREQLDRIGRASVAVLKGKLGSNNERMINPIAYDKEGLVIAVDSDPIVEVSSVLRIHHQFDTRVRGIQSGERWRKL